MCGVVWCVEGIGCVVWRVAYGVYGVWCVVRRGLIPMAADTVAHTAAAADTATDTVANTAAADTAAIQFSLFYTSSCSLTLTHTLT